MSAVAKILLVGMCASGSTSEVVVPLDPNLLGEASGFAFSRLFPSTSYHVNDSGDGAYVYVMDTEKKSVIRKGIPSFRPVDVEDLATAPCDGKKSCLIIADIGDNDEERRKVQLVLLPEPESPASPFGAPRILALAYPDGPHNAESLAVHPNGDLYLATKEKAKKKDPLRTRIYRLPAAAWQTPEKEKSVLFGKPVHKLTLAGELTLDDPALGRKAPGKKVTSMDISPDGRRFALLTGKSIIEFHQDLSKWDGKAVPEYQVLDLAPMPQIEALAYSRDGDGFYYTSESSPKKRKKAAKRGKDFQEAALMYLKCSRVKSKT